MSPNFVPTVILLSIFLSVFTWWLVYIYLDQPCSDATLAQYSRLHRHCAALSHQLEHHSGDRSDIRFHFWGPTWSCPLREEIGHSVGEGSSVGTKWICDVDHIDKDTCLVYSFGTTANYSFESEIHRNYGCEVHVFDQHADDVATIEGVEHHNWSAAKLPKLARVIEHLGHKNRDIDIMTLNIHGCELGLLSNPELWMELRLLGTRIDQIILTVDSSDMSTTQSSTTNDLCPNELPYSPQSLHSLFKLFSRNGYAVFHREHSHAPALRGRGDGDRRDGGEVYEFSFVRLDYDCDLKIANGASKYLSF